MYRFKTLENLVDLDKENSEMSFECVVCLVGRV